MGEPFFIIMFFAILAVPALNDNYFLLCVDILFPIRLLFHDLFVCL